MTQNQTSLNLLGIDFAEHLTTAILVLDAQLQVRYFNTACCALLSIGEKRLVNQYFPALFQFSDLNVSHLLSTLKTKQGFGVSDVHCVMPDGRHILVDITATWLETSEPSLLIELRQVDQQRKISMESLRQASNQFSCC